MPCIRTVLVVAMFAVLLLAQFGCATRTYQTYPRTAAVSDRVHQTFAAKSRALEADERLTPEEYELRRRYQVYVLKMLHEFEGKRMLLLAEELTQSEARQLDEAMVVAYRMIETLASFPGRMEEDGTPSDEQTASVLSGTPDLPVP